MSGTASAALGLIAALPGVRAALLLSPSSAPAVRSAEERYESSAALPIENIGVRHALERETTIAILKDSSFRKPPGSTLYLVEEGSAPEGEGLSIGGRSYRIVGEEIVAEGQEPGRGAVALSGTFYLYPDRRTSSSRPSRFVLPPVPFPELAGPPWIDRVRSVVSASPSPMGDACLRRICGFPDDPELATLLVGFDSAGEA